MAIFAKYDGIDGESNEKRHKAWIDVSSVDWAMYRPGDSGGQGRRRSAPVVEDLTLTFEYDKAAPKLQESLLLGTVIPSLEIEHTSSLGGGKPATYLRYELENVMITGVQVSAAGDERPMVVVANSFEGIEVTYTEVDGKGRAKGTVEYSWTAEEGDQ